MSYFQGDSIFWIEVEKIKTNPFQPRKDFDEEKLKSLADSVRQYGVLQPLVVTRKEIEKEDGGITTEYELIAGERRLRASKMAMLRQVPVIIKSGEEDSLMKLELAIIENVQREDLNPIDRAIAFNRLVSEFGFKHGQVAKKIGKSREYVSNTLRLLTLPEDIKQAVSNQRISEGHARTLMMLSDRPEEQATLFKEVIYKHLTVRETETIARKIAHDKVRKRERTQDPELIELEDKLSESLGTRVQIESRENGGKITIDFFSPEDIRNIVAHFNLDAPSEHGNKYEMLDRFINSQRKEESEAVQQEIAHEGEAPRTTEDKERNPFATIPTYGDFEEKKLEATIEGAHQGEDDSTGEKEEKPEDDGLYSVTNFTI